MRRAVSRLPAKLWWAVAAIVVLLGTGVLGGGLVARAFHDFGDVSDGAFYHNDVSWIVDRSVTAGCGGGNYCPNNNVTRGQMATFLRAEGEALTPTFLDRSGGDSTAALDLDVNPVVCATVSDYTPTYEQQAVILARVSVSASAALSFWAYGMYSTNSGATWNFFSPSWSAESGATTGGQDVALAYTGHTNLTPGTPYRFAIQLFRAVPGGGTGDATGHWCALTVEILNRNP